MDWMRAQRSNDMADMVDQSYGARTLRLPCRQSISRENFRVRRGEIPDRDETLVEDHDDVVAEDRDKFAREDDGR